jgi:hypothetical protein
MAITIFRSFLSTINPFRPGSILANLKVLVDSTTGAPVGIQNFNANGPDGIWTPIDVTAAQVAAPNAVMLADINATYRLNVAPYTRYHSNGVSLISLSAGADVQQSDGLFGTMIAYSPLTITRPEGETFQGTVYVRTVPA